MKTNRISIIGISGSGKSVFARILAERTHLPLFHMDVLLWKGNWEAIPEKDYLEAHKALIQKDQWIIEGYIDEKMSDRLKRSDMIIFLDYPGWLCCFRIFKRWFKHRKQGRPELPKEAYEKLGRDFLWTVLMRKERILIEKTLRVADSKNLVIAQSPRELKRVTKSYFQFE